MTSAGPRRLLFCSSGGAGHLRPMLPLAAAARRHGHAVLWVTAPDAVRDPAALGIETRAAGCTITQARQRYRRRWPEWAALQGEARGAHLYPRLFGAVIAPAMLPALERAIDDWQPDLVVHEVAALAAPLACARRGLAHWTHGIGLAQPPTQLRAAGEQVAGLWHAAGQPAPADGGAFAQGYLDIAPPGLARHADAVPCAIQPLSPSAAALPRRHPLPDALRDALRDAPRHGSQPLVYLSFGTVFHESAALEMAVRALADLPVRALVTAADAERCGALRAVAPQLHILPFVDQTEVLPRCDLVVSHGGAGTVLGACAFGRPQLVLPQAADQFRNARALSLAGAGRVLAPEAATTDRIAAAVEQLLDDPAPRRAAEALAREIAAMPSAEDVVDTITART